MDVVSYTVDSLQAHEQRKDAKLFAKATEEDPKRIDHFLASNENANPVSVSAF
jgi:hypothetical protein